MTIWILVLVMLASLAALGYRQGAIRVAFSFVGILFSVMLAGPLGRLIMPQLPRLGFQDPMTTALAAPFITFVTVLTLFKVAGYFVHRKTDLYYKYKAGDLRMALWQRLNARLGLGLGMLNALAYLVAVSFIIYNTSYWTTQVALSDDEPKWIKLLNRLGRDSETTGYARIARAVNPMPEIFFKTADLAGMLYQNPQLCNRLANYPMFISLAEREEFKQLGQDTDFQNAWKQHAPIAQLINNGQFNSIRQNQELSGLIWDMIQDNLDDLQNYLQTGQSEKYGSEKIIGRWSFNAIATIGKMLRAQPNISAQAMRILRQQVTQSYAQTAFVAGGDGQAFLKNLPQVKKTQKGEEPADSENITWEGDWKNNGTNYTLSLSSDDKNKSMPAQIDDTRLIITLDKETLVFDREN